MNKKEPYAWLTMIGEIVSNYTQKLRVAEAGDIPLYTEHEWIDLTDDEMLMIYGQKHEGKKYSLGRMVQQALKEKNT